MKNRDEKMRLRYQEKEDARLINMACKQMRKMKEAGYARTDKNEYEDNDYQRIRELAAALEG